MTKRMTGLCLLLVLLCACGKRTETYTIATDAVTPPFSFPGGADGAHCVGIDPELLDAIAENQGFRYKLKLMSVQEAVRAVERGEVDGVLSAVSITARRRETLQFSDVYYRSHIVLAVPAGNVQIQTLEDLAGKTVAVRSGSQAAAYAEMVAETYRFNVVSFSTMAQTYADVGVASDACIDDYSLLGYSILQGSGLYITDTLEQTAEYALAVGKADTDRALLDSFNAGLVALQEDGTYDSILKKYVAAPVT